MAFLKLASAILLKLIYTYSDMNVDLSGIILFVKDTDKLKSFYIDNLMLKLKEEIPGEWVLLKAGKSELGLHKAGTGYSDLVSTSVISDNNTKIVFDIGKEQDIFSLREKLIRNKVSVKEIKTWDGFDYIICDGEDPEGNVFQLRQIKQEKYF